MSRDFDLVRKGRESEELLKQPCPGLLWPDTALDTRRMEE